MILGMRAGEKIVADADFRLHFEKRVMEVLIDFFWCGFFGIGANGNRCAVGVGAGNKKNVVLQQTLVTGKNISGQIRPCKVSYMNISICVRPGGCDKNRF